MDLKTLIKYTPGMNNMDLARTIVKWYDKSNTIGNVLKRMKPIHMRICLASYLMVYMLKLAGEEYEMMNNHEFWFTYYESLADKFFENAVDMVTERYQRKYEVAIAAKPIPQQCFYHQGKACELSAQNMDDDGEDDDTMLSPEEIARRKKNALPTLLRLMGFEPPNPQNDEQAAATTTETAATDNEVNNKPTFDRDFIQPNDILPNSKHITKAQRAKIILEDNRKLRNLESRFQKMMTEIQMFHDDFTSDPTIVKMIQTNDPNLFNTKMPHMSKIALFDADNFQRTFRTKDMPDYEPKRDLKFQNIGQFWNYIKRKDEADHKEMCVNEGHDVPPDQALSHRATLWYNLNNAILLSTLLINLKDEDLTELFQCVHQLYDDFLNTKVDNLKDMYTRLIDDVRRIFPSSFNGNNVGLPSDELMNFLFEALIQNTAYFQDVVNQIQYAIPDEYKEILKDQGVVDIDKFNLRKKLREQMKKIFRLKHDIRNEKITLLGKLGEIHQEVLTQKPEAPTSGLHSVVSALTSTTSNNVRKRKRQI